MNIQNTWEAETPILFTDLLLSASVDTEIIEDFSDPSFSDNLLLYGIPGTGKTAICSAILASRTGSQNISARNTYYNFKEREVRESINGEMLSRTAHMSKLCEEDITFIFDEIDELTINQQKEVTAFIDSMNRSKTPVTILATTNVDINTPLEARKLSSALRSRFTYKQRVQPQPAASYAPLVHKKLCAAGFQMSIDDSSKFMESQFADSLVSFRDVRASVNTLIRRRQRKTS